MFLYWKYYDNKIYEIPIKSYNVNYDGKTFDVIFDKQFDPRPNKLGKTDVSSQEGSLYRNKLWLKRANLDKAKKELEDVKYAYF